MRTQCSKGSEIERRPHVHANRHVPFKEWQEDSANAENRRHQEKEVPPCREDVEDHACNSQQLHQRPHLTLHREASGTCSIVATLGSSNRHCRSSSLRPAPL